MKFFCVLFIFRLNDHLWTLNKVCCASKCFAQLFSVYAVFKRLIFCLFWLVRLNSNLRCILICIATISTFSLDWILLLLKLTQVHNNHSNRSWNDTKNTKKLKVSHVLVIIICTRLPYSLKMLRIWQFVQQIFLTMIE